MSFDTEYNLKELKEELSDLFDEDGKRYTGVIFVNIIEAMKTLKAIPYQSKLVFVDTSAKTYQEDGKTFVKLLKINYDTTRG